MMLLIKKKKSNCIVLFYRSSKALIQVSPLGSQQTCYRHLTPNSNISLHMAPSAAPRYHHLQKQHHHN